MLNKVNHSGRSGFGHPKSDVIYRLLFQGLPLTNISRKLIHDFLRNPGATKSTRVESSRLPEGQR